MMRMNLEHVEDLKQSKTIGYLQPCIIDKRTGKVLVGRHRKLADPNWSEVVIDTEEIARVNKWPVELVEELIISAGNVQRTISEEESRDRLYRIAKQLQALGVKDDHICTSICKLPGMPSGAWVRKILAPFPEFKMQSEARDQKRDTSSAESKDTPTSTPPSIAEADSIMEEAAEQASGVKEAGRKLANLTGKDPVELIFPDCKCANCPHLHECH